jgi:hypothetical protein
MIQAWLQATLLLLCGIRYCMLWKIGLTISYVIEVEKEYGYSFHTSFWSMKLQIGANILHNCMHLREVETSLFLLMMQTLCSQVLKYFNASPRDYKCIFTSGATAALKLVGECFPWSRDSCYMYTMENHNSVLGIREYPTMVTTTYWLVNVYIIMLVHAPTVQCVVATYLYTPMPSDIRQNSYFSFLLPPQ